MRAGAFWPPDLLVIRQNFSLRKQFFLAAAAQAHSVSASLRNTFRNAGRLDSTGTTASATNTGLPTPSVRFVSCRLNAIADYLYRNRAHMRYNEYLANGWPIASGRVEGACKNRIKDRMKLSGMGWTEQMAEAIVQLRAIYLSGDFDAYWEFHITQDQRRLYPCA